MIRNVNFTNDELIDIKHIISAYICKTQEMDNIKSQIEKNKADLEKIKLELDNYQKMEIELFDRLSKKYGNITLAEVRSAINPSLSY